jgi:hypothetical protein
MEEIAQQGLAARMPQRRKRGGQGGFQAHATTFRVARQFASAGAIDRGPLEA